VPPISVNIRTGLTGCSSASSISCRGMGEYTVKSVWPARRSCAIASTVASRTEHSQHTRRGRRVEDGGQRVRELHDTLAFPRCGAGSTSFTSEIDTVGKFFTNNRNHMKNQPKIGRAHAELQSPDHLVCRLLLEKKKKKKHKKQT